MFGIEYSGEGTLCSEGRKTQGGLHQKDGCL
jgi:hypothetical protein